MRMNISVPDALRERMKAFDDQANWSAVAAEAFGQEVERLEFLATIDDPVKRRLLATDDEDKADVYEVGKKAGMRWARDHARMTHLRRLSAQNEKMDIDWSEVGPDRVAQIALGDDRVAWEELPGMLDRPDTVALECGWLQGFVDGAIEIFDAV